MLINAGIVEIIYIEEYDDDLAAQLAKEAGLNVRRVEMVRSFGRSAGKQS
jgi:deoxycytidylate deaminase